MFIISGAAHGTNFFGTLVHNLIPEVVGVIELLGLIVIVCGTVKAFYMFVMSMFCGKHYPIKIALGNALALGLEFKMGAEILKTVTIQTIDEIVILGAIIALRATLSLIIHFEVKSEKEHEPHNEDISKSEY